MTPEQKLAERIRELDLRTVCTFVPWSQSRNKAESMPSLNWQVELYRGKRLLLTTDYMQGCAHCPSYKQGARMVMAYYDALKSECETGRAAKPHRPKIKEPLPEEVMWSLLLDASALDHADFESWAADYGYDTDSREAERIYCLCLAHALILNAALGPETLRELQELAHEI